MRHASVNADIYWGDGGEASRSALFEMRLMAFSRASIGMLLMLLHLKRVTSGSRSRIAWKVLSESFVALIYDLSVMVRAVRLCPVTTSGRY